MYRFVSVSIVLQMPSRDRARRAKEKERKETERTHKQTGEIPNQEETHVADSCGQGTSGTPARQLTTNDHLYHDFNPNSVLQGELPIAALDMFSHLCGLLPPSFVYGAVMRNEVLHTHSVDAATTVVQIHYTSGHYLVSSQQNGVVTIQ